MKQFLLFLFFSLSANAMWSQITVTNSTFPQPGDTLRTAIDGDPGDIVVGDAGADLQWDFTSLRIPFVQQTIFLDAALGNNFDTFPGATMFSEILISDSLAETYYRADENSLQLLGYVGGDPTGFGLDLVVQLDPPTVERVAPLTYGDFNASESAVNLPIASDDIPQALLDSFPLPFTPDSLRIRINTETVGVVDAWGELTIPGGENGETYEVLREKRTEIREIRLDIKLSIFPWQDVTDLLPPELREFGSDTTRSYHFFSNVAKEPIAIVTMEDDLETAAQVVFKANDITSSVSNFAAQKNEVTAFPNPTNGPIQFRTEGFEEGRYFIKIYNVLGAEVWQQEYYLAKASTIVADLSHLRKGLYLYSIVSETGKILGTHRLVRQ